MNEKNSADNGSEPEKGFKFFAFKRLAVGLLLLIAILWALGVLLGYFENPSPIVARHDSSRSGRLSHAGNAPVDGKKSGPPAMAAENNAHVGHKAEPAGATKEKVESSPAALWQKDRSSGQQQSAAKHQEPLSQSTSSGHPAPVEDKTTKTKSHSPDKTTEDGAQNQSHPKPVAHPEGKSAVKAKPAGVTFVEAVISPLHYELMERFWGWRPNDILNFTDNVNNFQLGVLEVTRRTAVALSERISRTGTTDTLDPNLQNAVNWFMIKADRYWFPSAESKYKEGLKELAKYRDKLMEGRASFHTRSDNLIPLLASFEDLLGSCDENLVKAFEEDGSPVSFFRADDYVYYTRGVASAMLSILEAVHHEFISILETRHGTELLHHAIESCRRAVEIDPIMVINSDLDGIFANHRANMAAPISHARFYLGQLIKTLST